VLFVNSFYKLDPELILQSAESAGLAPTGEFTQLNSYENRVFDLRLEDPAQPRVIAKFYRPGRWDLAAIKEEHSFLQELAEADLTVVQALKFKNKNQLTTVGEISGMYFSFFPKISGRMPVEFSESDLKSVGRVLAQLHNIGARKDFSHRPILAEHPWTPWETLDFLNSWIIPELSTRYNLAAERIISELSEQINPQEFIRIHGDSHRGNVLMADTKTERNFFFVDFDDTCMGPVSQDLWMLFSSFTNSDEQEQLIIGYEEFRKFPRHQIDWFPLLRGLRVIQYAAWIARRWEDPSFPRLFPDFNTYNYWAEEVETLEKIVNSLHQ
jgi:Ser/Thr protein kinase RdoA (MazF antagonist)